MQTPPLAQPLQQHITAAREFPLQHTAAAREFVANSAIAWCATSVDVFFASPIAQQYLLLFAACAPDADLEESAAAINWRRRKGE